MKHNSIKLKGIYRDRLITVNGERFDSGWRSNIIVNRCRELLSAFMKGDSVTGVQFISLGQGDANWDSLVPESPLAETSQLEDASPFILDVSAPQVTLEYINSANEAVLDPTNRLQITVNLEAGSPPIGTGEETYPLREFGLFGRIGTVNYMIDYVRHPVVHKGPEDTLVRTIRLVF